MSKQKLQHLIHDIKKIDTSWDRKIAALSLDSREIKKDTLFLACVGTEQDGRNFIDTAIENGAAAVLADADFDSEDRLVEHNGESVPVIYVNDLKQYIGPIASRFYQTPSENMTVIAVTGTNGKTSCCHFLAQSLAYVNKKVAVLGTVGNGIWGEQTQGQLTTPDAISIQAYLAEFKKQGVEYVVMEASSHGLVQGRINGIHIDIAVFTNLSRDRLDYHKNMRAYGEAKKLLFKNRYLKATVINVDDEFGRHIYDTLPTKIKKYCYTSSGRMGENQHMVTRVQQVHLNLEGLTASTQSPWGDGILHTSLLGRINLSNLLAVFTCLGILNFSIDDIMQCMKVVQPVPGRMQLFGGDGKPYVVVDYAHTPDALRQVLETLKEYTDGEVWCVFGCGGDRDQGKRKQMGQIAESIADHAVITDDNPRHEKPHMIAADILQGMARPEFAVVEHDRRRAISHAINCAKAKDIVLIAGKGHESYQLYNDDKHPFNDELEVQMILSEYQP